MAGGRTDDVLGVLDGGARAVDARAERTEAVVVRRADHDQRHVQVEDLPTEQVRDLAEEDGGEVGAPRVHRRAHVAADEQRVRAEDSCSATGHRLGASVTLVGYSPDISHSTVVKINRCCNKLSSD